MKVKYDITIIGAGFAGSLMAMILHNLGYKVLLIEKKSHPRFAIGESSTPVADMILRDLANSYDLPWLYHFSRYGSWQKHFPQVVCGLKRGFSYFKHHSQKSFSTDDCHSNELLVAASNNDIQSDTNWLRSDFDAFLVDKVTETGIPYREQTTIETLERTGTAWNVSARQNDTDLTFSSSWIIDATGAGGLLYEQLGISSSSQNLKTNTRAVFSHFHEVTPWSEWLSDHKISQYDYPYDPDHSALHQLLDEGWMWMLRFNNDLTSCGIVINGNKKNTWKDDSPATLWQNMLDKYPSLQQLFKSASISGSPGRLIKTQRLQRCAAKGVGDGWIALPHTIGFIDPLHSTGIAHTLSGVERVAHLFKMYGNRQDQLKQYLKEYERAVFNELTLVDLLVSGCTESTHNMELFVLYSMLYFTAAISYEQLRLKGRFDIERHQFLSADDPVISTFVRERYDELQQLLNGRTPDQSEVSAYKKRIQQDIEPYNIANLLRPRVPNMYRHTVAEL